MDTTNEGMLNVNPFYYYYCSSISGNREFIEQLSQWTFQEKGVLKVVGHSHHKQNDTEQLEWYRVKDDIVSCSTIAID